MAPEWKRVSCIITPDEHAAFKKACVDLGITMDTCLRDAVIKAIEAAAELERVAQKGAGDG